MNKIPIISQNTLSTLFNNVENNTSAYLEDNLAQLLEGALKELTDTSIDDGLSSKLIWEKDEREGILDAKNSGILFKSLHGITPYQARDERILAAISHIYLREYTIQRHKIAGSDIDKIKRHFFARGNGFRSIERDNSVGRLWWNGYFVARCKGKEDFDELLELLCSDTDFRSQLVERPGFSTVPQVALAILQCKKKFQEQEPNNNFFTGRENPKYRQWFRKINLYGGSHLFASMDYGSLHDLFWSAMMEVNRN